MIHSAGPPPLGTSVSAGRPFTLRWAKIASWHAIQHESDAGHSTYCGRVATSELVDNLGSEGKTCEACFRIVMRLGEAIGALE